jgi:hypothetical protein
MATMASADGGILHTLGDLRGVFVTVDFDSSYPTGGESFPLVGIGLSQILYAEFQSKAGYVFSWDYTNFKLQAYCSNGASPAALNEVPNTTNLSTVTGVRGVFWGR